MANKAYVYIIYPNKMQKEQCQKTFGCCRFVYNQTLAYRKDAYEKEKKSVSKTDCNNYCNRELKKAYEWLKEVDENGEDAGNIFYEEFLVIKKDLYIDLIRYLSGKFKPFSELIERAKKIQEIKLKKYGVGDRLNATMTKFVLNVNHGLIETSRNENENRNIDVALTREQFIENIKKVEEEVIKKRNEI